jgi:hypothetical protein
MVDETMPTTPLAGDDGQPPVGTPTPTPDAETGQEPKSYDQAYVQQLRNEAAKHRREAAANAAKLKEIEDANLTEAQKTQQRAEAAEARAAKLERDLMRTKIAAKHGLPDVLADRLMGDDEAAMEADAKVLAKLVATPPPASSGSPANGASNRGERQLTAEDARKMTPRQIQEAMDKGLFNNAIGRTG